MFPQSQFRPRRPRRTLDHLFGDDADVLDVVAAMNPDARARPALPSPQQPSSFLDPNSPAGRGELTPTRPGVSATALPPPVDRGPISPTINLPEMGEADLDMAARRGRPYPGTNVSEIERWEPQGAKRSFGGVAKGFLRGGIPGAIGSLIDPNQNDRQDKARMLSEADSYANRSRKRTREGQQDRLLESQILENEAQADARKRPPRPILGREVLEDGTTIQTELNPETGQFQPARGVDGQPIVLGRPKTQEPMVEMVLSDGRKVMVPPSSALGADATRENRRETALTKQEEREEKFREGLTKREAKLKEASALVSNAEIYENNATEVEKQLVNATKEDAPGLLAQINGLKQEAQMLRRQAVGARAEAAAIPATRPDRPSAQKSTKPGKGFSISAYLARNPGATEGDAKAFAADKYKGVPIVR